MSKHERKFWEPGRAWRVSDDQEWRNVMHLCKQGDTILLKAGETFRATQESME